MGCNISLDTLKSDFHNMILKVDKNNVEEIKNLLVKVWNYYDILTKEDKKRVDSLVTSVSSSCI
jgi:hypothetical protein